MPSSLEKLASNLHESEFKNVQKFYSNEEANLLLKKGVYPYDYMDNFTKFSETDLPPKDKFYSRLNEQNITDADYEHAQNVWSKFCITNICEYTDLYVKSDVLLLADIFENFRDLCMNTYMLDPAWYFTAPGLSWDSMLKMTGVEIELLTDYEMFLFVERGIRGGISQCSHRYSIENNSYLPNYDKSRASNYILYLDANNLYGWAMNEPLPLKNFKWLHDVENFNVLNIPDENDAGYILEVDLNYPSTLHDNHSDLPLALEMKNPPNCREKATINYLV
ncbi:hypothetical protein AVEN_227333-1 [Araneus ventricosus]|uniref:DNA-directed DNA polymerase n=1 Tax=Araneus ventricosus TaxID=182803 RepID=A0A4Y2GS69_ARAVE|nr:hypothetical protein AVEN_227333-1 [Araneus ventricosus]